MYVYSVLPCKLEFFANHEHISLKYVKSAKAETDVPTSVRNMLAYR